MYHSTRITWFDVWISSPCMFAINLFCFSLELGGKNAAIVFDDADLDKAVATLKRSCFLNQVKSTFCRMKSFKNLHS